MMIFVLLVLTAGLQIGNHSIEFLVLTCPSSKKLCIML